MVGPKFSLDIVPKLSSNLRKGDLGRVLVVGGSVEYTGAPYFAAISALKTGADMAFIICAPEAGIPIKTYSPELIVYPILGQLDAPSREVLGKLLDRINIAIIGPGLGMHSENQISAQEILNLCQIRKIPVILDGDGIHLISKLNLSNLNGSLLSLTPNNREFSRLCQYLKVKECACEASLRLNNSLILAKGEVDEISLGHKSEICVITGIPRRCSGQGDILTGILATFTVWVNLFLQNDDECRLQAAMNACIMLRQSALKGFHKYGRSVVAGDIINSLSEYLKEQIGEY